MIIINVTKNEATVVQTEKLTSGTIGLECKFNFSEEWENLEKIAVCSCGNVTKDVFDVSDTIVVPWEVMAVHGKYLEIGVYGKSSDGGVIIPTVYATVGAVCKGADPSGDESVAPTPTLWDKLRDKTKELSDTIETANTATKEANEATRKANLATENTNAVIESANKVVSAAGEATRSAEKATADTLLAKDQVVEATEKANIAAKRANDAARGINDNFANALKGTVTGEAVLMTDVSPIEHEMSVKAVSVNNIPLYPYDTDTELIAGCSYTITDDGVYEIQGVSKGEFDAVLIKTLTLPAGEYTFWAKGYDSNLGVMFVRGVAVGDNVICHFMNDIPDMGYDPTSPVTTTLGDEVISIWFTPTIETGTSYSWNIKPYLSKGAEIAEVSSAKVIQFGENLFNPDDYDVKEVEYVNANGTNIRYGMILDLEPGNYVATLKPLKDNVYKANTSLYGLVRDKSTHYVAIGENGKNKTLHLWVGEAKTPLFTVGENEEVLIYDGEIQLNYERACKLLSPENGYIQINENTKGITDASQSEKAINKTEYSISTDGTIEGVTSLSPRTALYTDTAGVNIKVEYNRDINKAFEELRNAVISLAADI